MGLGYFGDRGSWSAITREERVFCAALWYHLQRDLTPFLGVLARELKFTDSATPSAWEVGYEVCLYRDLQFAGLSEQPAENNRQKHTLDLALFGPKDVVIIEAKAFTRFGHKQTENLERDRERAAKALKGKPNVHLVALAAKTYFENTRARRGRGLSERFDCCLTWEKVAGLYPHDPLLKRAGQVYGEKSAVYQ